MPCGDSCMSMGRSLANCGAVALLARGGWAEGIEHGLCIVDLS